MKKALILFITAVGLSLSGVGCGSKSSGSAATAPTDPGANGGGVVNQCQPWQVYTESFGCLNPGPCPSGYGYNTADGRCYKGTIGSELPQGVWDNGVTVTDVEHFKTMLRDLNRCYWNNCPTASWAYLSVQISGQTYQAGGTGGGWQNLIPGFNHSSAYMNQHSYNYGAPQSRQARINLMTATEYYGGSSTLQFTSSAYPTQTGFQVVVNGVGHTSAYNQRIQFNFTYLDVNKNEIKVDVVYKDKVVLTGSLIKSY